MQLLENHPVVVIRPSSATVQLQLGQLVRLARELALVNLRDAAPHLLSDREIHHMSGLSHRPANQDYQLRHVVQQKSQFAFQLLGQQEGLALMMGAV